MHLGKQLIDRQNRIKGRYINSGAFVYIPLHPHDRGTKAGRVVYEAIEHHAVGRKALINSNLEAWEILGSIKKYVRSGCLYRFPKYKPSIWVDMRKEKLGEQVIFISVPPQTDALTKARSREAKDHRYDCDLLGCCQLVGEPDIIAST